LDLNLRSTPRRQLANRHARSLLAKGATYHIVTLGQVVQA
jgi:hypothetical protein